MRGLELMGLLLGVQMMLFRLGLLARSLSRIALVMIFTRRLRNDRLIPTTGGNSTSFCLDRVMAKIRHHHYELSRSTRSTISVSVCLPSDNTTYATATIVNHTSNLATIVGCGSQPQKVNTNGTTAEWIIDDAYTSATTHFPFPNYGTTFFYDCAAGTKAENVSLTGLQIRDAIDPSTNVTLSEATLTKRCENDSRTAC
jgi:hypothetical protein